MDDRSNAPNGAIAKNWRTPLFILPVLLLLVGLSLLSDFLFGSSPEQLMVEMALLGLIVTVAVFALVSVWLRYVREREQRLIKSNELEKVLHESAKFGQHSYSENFKRYVDEEFARWRLTPSERQIALHLLEGEDFKTIAEKRFTSEKTVRNQSRSIYEKADLSGRAALAAHFLKILLHAEETDRDQPSNSAEQSRSG
jgi:DNA-binding CsgD family transcriptional regulator